MSCLDDATVLGLVEGRLDPERIARVDEHIDSCPSCREVVTLVASSRSSVRVLARGDSVGRYVIGDVLGTGAMGRVYSAWEPELDRRVAIKVLLDEGDRDRLVREAQAMARLNHPNVVTVHEVGNAEAGVFVAMELVDGETLRAWAERRRGERSHGWRDVARVLAEVAHGLAAVHAAGVVHRDVKPDNVIVGADGRVRIGDFGLARSRGDARHATGTASAGTAPPTDSSTSRTAPATGSSTSAPPALAAGTLPAGTVVAGTPAYMAPEVLRGGAADAASDQFSFGVMAFELLAGKRPFAGTTWAELLASIEAGDERRIPDVPGWLDDTLRRCIAREPAARHPSMRAIAERLDARARRRSPVLWLTGLLGAAVLASTLTWALVRDGDTHDSAVALVPAWNEAARTQLVQRGVPARTVAAIEHWNADWIVERDDATRGARSDHADRAAARERCLVQRRDELAALLDASAAAPERLLDAVATLPAPRECRTADADPLPLDPAKARDAEAVLARLPALRAAVALSQRELARVIAESEALVAQARASTHAPTLADALLVAAEALRAVDRSADAAVAARDAVAAADRGHADLLRARAWLLRVAIAGDQRDLASADDLGALAHAAIERIGAPHLAASLARLRGHLRASAPGARRGDRHRSRASARASAAPRHRTRSARPCPSRRARAGTHRPDRPGP